MSPDRVRRDRLHAFTDLPNVGDATARDLRLLGFGAPADLAGQDPYALYDRLCEVTGVRQDPCVLDVYLYPSAQGREPQATYIDARRASDGKDVDRPDCIRALKK